MYHTVLVLACLACIGHVWSLRPTDDEWQSSPSAERLATLLMTLHPEASAFTPASLGAPVYARSRSAALPQQLWSRSAALPGQFWSGRISELRMGMVAAKDVFERYADEASWMQKKILGLPKDTLRWLSLSQTDSALAVACAVLGFMFTPSYRIWARAIGAFLASNIGLNSGQYLADSRQNAACVAIAEALAKDFDEVPDKKLKEVSEQCGMKVDQLPLILSELYFTFLEECISSKDIHTAELSQLKKLKTYLKMSASEVGTQVLKAARELSSKSEYPKFVFLADRVLRDDSKEGYAYEVMRVQKELMMDKDEWLKVADKAATPFYENALRKACMDGQDVSAAQLKEIRSYLGISDKLAKTLHEKTLDGITDSSSQSRARELLGM